MAEGIFNVLAKERGLSLRAESAGIMAVNGKAEPNAIEAAKIFGADISSHHTRRFQQSMLEEYDKIFCMTAACADMLKSKYPTYAEKIATVSREDISDPYGCDISVYQKTAAELEKAIKRLLDQEEEA